MRTLRAICFSDVHAHNFTNFADYKENAITTRMQSILSALEHMFDYAHKNEIKLLLFAGDLFHKRGSIDIGVFNEVYELFKNQYKKDLRIIMIAGNHDFVAKSENTHSLRHFDSIKGIDVLDNEVIEIDGFDIVGVPADSDKENLEKTVMGFDLENPGILITHSQITGSMTSSNFKFINGLPIDKLQKKYISTIIGDVHKYQLFDRSILVPGSLVQHNFGDINCTKYFHDVTFDEKGISTIKNIPTNQSEFFEISIEDIESTNDNTNYFKVIARREVTSAELSILQKNIKYFSIVYDIQYKKEDIGIEVKNLNDHNGLVNEYIGGLEIDVDKNKLFKMCKQFI